MKRIFLPIAFLLTHATFAVVLSSLVIGNTPTLSPEHSIFAEQEDFTYEVRWAFVKIGTIHIKTLGRLNAIAYIDSYEGLPFVNLHSIHYTEMDSTSYSRGGYAIDKEGTEWKGLNYFADRKANKVIVEQLYQRDPATPPYKREMKDTLQMTTDSFVDGLSIGFFPRLFIHSVQTVRVPTILKGNVGTTTFYFTKNRTTESIDALDEPVRVIEVEGTTDAVGVFGMTGDFTGWFSDDAAGVPIKGKLKVLLGNVTIELIHWNRRGWSPPQ